MATLYITEYAMCNDSGAPLEPAVAEQTVAIAAGSAASAALNAETAFVRLHTDAICSVKFGTAPVAAATNARMAAGETRLHSVRRVADAGSRLKVAVITNT